MAPRRSWGSPRQTGGVDVTVLIDPQSLGLPEEAGKPELIDFLITAVEDGLRCNCGRFGCLETVASGPGIARVAPRFGSLEKLSAAAQQGDPEATGALAGAAEHLGRVLSEYMMVLDLQVLMVGGGVSNIGPPLLRPMQESFDRHLADVAASVRVVPAALGSDSGVLGAAHRSRLLRDDRRSARW